MNACAFYFPLVVMTSERREKSLATSPEKSPKKLQVKNWNIELSLQDFCIGFLHIDKCFEWDQKRTCCFEKPCKRFGIQRYSLCSYGRENFVFGTLYQRSRWQHKKNLHVEDLAVASKPLAYALELLRTFTGIHVTFYISYQPCHHSGGNRWMNRPHSKSCAETLLAWYEKALKPYGISLTAKCCGLYRAHWEDESLFRSDDDVANFGQKASRAREGIRLLKNAGIEMCGMTRKDWKFLAQFIKDDCIPRSMLRAHDRYDKLVDAFLRE